MSNIIISKDLNEQKLATLTNDVVKSNLTNYYNELQSIGKATWNAYKSFALAYASMSKETVVNADGQQVERFKTKGQFYDFVGVNDSTGSLMLRAVAFNEMVQIDGKRLEEYGFTAGKVDMLSRVGQDDFTTFLSYCASCDYGTLETLAGISDKSLRAIIKQWEDDGKPDKRKPMSSKQDEPKQDELKQDEPKQDELKQDEPKQDEPKQDEPKQDEPKQDEPKQDEPKQDVKREDILEMSLHYTGLDTKSINEFCKWLKAEMLKACK